MKTKEELNEIKEEIEKLDKKLQELTEEELEQVTGGNNGHNGPCPAAVAGALCGILFAQTSDVKLAGK